MTIKAADVKNLREKTGLGMMECKKALEESNGNLEEAITNLRKNSALKAEKKSTRTAVEGVITVVKDTDNNLLFVEINCETDFVAKDQNFIDFCEEVSREAVKASNADDILETITEVIEEKRMSLVQKIGENVVIRKAKKLSGEITEFYVHSNKKIASGVALSKGNNNIAKDIAMHIAASSPMVLSPNELDEEYVRKEREIFTSQVSNEDKPQEILEKMIEGKLNKHLADVSLLKQPFVKDPSLSIEKFINNANSEITSFVRLEVGEGIEVEKKDFAEEVKSQLNN